MNVKDSYKYSQYIPKKQETRWATVEEIRKASAYIDLEADRYPAAGLPLLSNGHEAYVDDKDTHSLIFGATGSKKTRLFCMPLINIMLKAGESFVATDPKGELYAKTSGLAKKMGYKTVVLNFRDLSKGDQWNPLALPYALYQSGAKDEATALLNDFVNMLVEPSGGKNELFWLQTSRSLALAHFLLLMEYAKPEEVHMSSFVPLCTKESIRLIVDKLDLLNDTSLASVNYRSVLAGSEVTTDNIVVSLFAASSLFAAQKQLCRMLSKNTFDIRMFGREKTAVYLIVPDEKTTLHFLVTTFIKQAYEILIREAQKGQDFRLPVRVNFVLDEFCNIPKIPDMASMISAARSRNMRYFLVVQSKHQLVGKYGEDADTIKGNCDNWVFLTSRELDLLREISELCGSIRTEEGNVRQLISVSELQRLDKEKGEALIMHAREYPIITEMADIDRYPMFGTEKSAPCSDIVCTEIPQFQLNYFISAFCSLYEDTSQYLFDVTREKVVADLREKVKEKKKRTDFEDALFKYMEVYDTDTQNSIGIDKMTVHAQQDTSSQEENDDEPEDDEGTLSDEELMNLFEEKFNRLMELLGDSDDD